MQSYHLAFLSRSTEKNRVLGDKERGWLMKKTMLKTEFWEQYVYHTAVLGVKDIKGRTESSAEIDLTVTDRVLSRHSTCVPLLFLALLLFLSPSRAENKSVIREM